MQEQEVQRRQKELEATVIKPADAERQAAIVRAEAAKQSAILEAEGRRSALIAMAEAEQEKLRKEGAGRAAALEVEGRAEAAKIEAIGLAQAKAIEAQGVAEATAILRKAEAWKQFNDAARLQTILEKLPAIIQSSTGVFGAVAAPLGNIDKLVVIDQGERAPAAPAPASNGWRSTSPAVVFNLLQQLEALGLNLPEVLKHLGVGGKEARVGGPADGRWSIVSEGRLRGFPGLRVLSERRLVPRVEGCCAISARQAVLRPFVLLLRESPSDSARAQPMQRDGSGGGHVDRIDAAGHRYTNPPIRRGERRRCQPRPLRSEQQRDAPAVGCCRRKRRHVLERLARVSVQPP